MLICGIIKGYNAKKNAKAETRTMALHTFTGCNEFMYV